MDDFSLVGVDHMVIKTKQVDEVTRMFLAQLKFRRVSSDSAEMVRGECRVCVDQLCSNSLSKDGVCSVTDIAFVVTGLESLLTRARAVDARIIVEDISPVLEHPRLGSHRRAVVKSVVGNVMHTLIEIDADSAASRLAAPETSVRDVLKLPVVTVDDDEISDLDHIAIACRIGETESILRWYEKIFQMKSFDFGEGGDGIQIQVDDIGMQLKALEYWKCAEKGLYAPSHSRKKFPLLVVAEPLPGVDANNQIDVFITEHGGPGVQHIGLNTSDICRSKRFMQQKGVSFIEPPPTYYKEGGKLRDIIKAGEIPAKLQEHGILIDYEDFDGTDLPGLNSGYLMQVFTKPLFTERTFFLELIERRGARGFGAGNITALFKAVQAYMRQEC